ncbi:hypothetical protein PT277_01435 [Acetobacteraceae bacterium ESL0709]|nr:hypothetical protein [Acetobacteraceae bacterium ESL0697]MDF7677363.1 hypothetical protein [Acetobacteraceae bacterium ESL0709]
MTIPSSLTLLLTLSVLSLAGCTETRTRQTCLYLASFSKEEQAGTAEELKAHPDLKYLPLQVQEMDNALRQNNACWNALNGAGNTP